MRVKLYVGNLPFSFTEEQIRDLFSEYGQVEDVSLITDRKSGKSKGFGFVEMVNESEADDLINALDGNDIDGRPLKVNRSVPVRRVKK